MADRCDLVWWKPEPRKCSVLRALSARRGAAARRPAREMPNKLIKSLFMLSLFADLSTNSLFITEVEIKSRRREDISTFEQREGPHVRSSNAKWFRARSILNLRGGQEFEDTQMKETVYPPGSLPVWAERLIEFRNMSETQRRDRLRQLYAEEGLDFSQGITPHRYGEKIRS